MTRKNNQPPTLTTAPQLDRRTFLRQGLALDTGVGVAGLTTESKAGDLTVPESSHTLGPGLAEADYDKPSAHEHRLIRKWLPWVQVARESSVSFTPLHRLASTITPNGLFFERHHSGVPDIDPA